MAETASTVKTGPKKRGGIRPVIVLYRADGKGELEVVELTRDAFKVIEMMDTDTSLRYKKIDAKIGR